MALAFDVHEMAKLLDALYILSAQRATVINLRGETIIGAGKDCDFCHQICETPEGRRDCFISDTTALAHAAKCNDVAYSYRCHAGLCEILIPIRYNNKLIAALMLGQFLDDSSVDEQWEYVKNVCSGRFDITSLQHAFFKLPRITKKEIDAYTQIVTTFSTYIQLKSFIEEKSNDIIMQLNNYIKAYYHEDISLRQICMELGISKSALCKTVKTELDCSVMQLIRKYRMEEAARLLSSTSLPIAQIAYQVGYSDSNYFSRRFLSFYGISPKKYRDRHLKTINK